MVKPPKPEFYKGKRDALEINAWVDQIERYARYFLSEGMELVDFAVFYLLQQGIGGQIGPINSKRKLKSGKTLQRN